MTNQTHKSTSWGLGADRAMAVGEGDPAKWAALGLEPITKEWMDALGPLGEIAAAIRPNQPPDAVTRVVGGPCIYKSDGDFDRLPISVVWETINVILFAKVLNVEARITIPVGEECFRAPELTGKYLEMGKKLTAVVDSLAKELDLDLKTVWRTEKCTAGDIKAEDLYGLFFPFADTPKLKNHPAGEPDEKVLLEAYTGYCAAYRNQPGGLKDTDLVVDGIHLSRSVLIGIGKNGTYIPAAPLPAFESEDYMMIDEIIIPVISEEWDIPEGWWPDVMTRKILGHSLESIRKMIVKGTQ